MKAIRYLPLLVLGFILAACSPQPLAAAAPASTATAPAAATTGTVFNTAVGELVYVSARFVDEVNGVTPAQGSRLLLVVLERPDKSAIDVQQFQDAHMKINILGEDGSSTISTMGGYVGEKYDQFAIGFQVPETVKTFKLAWGDNPPLDITADVE
jgi:hypothetical protein